MGAWPSHRNFLLENCGLRDAHRPRVLMGIIVGLPAGSAPDIGARLIGQWLSERLGQQFIVDNRPGANSNIATEAVVRAAADGYTLLLAIAGNAVNATLYDKLNFNFIRDIAPEGSARVRLRYPRASLRVSHDARYVADNASSRQDDGFAPLASGALEQISVAY
jgi:Tripartite tricarboxylate transporter family receptor